MPKSYSYNHPIDQNCGECDIPEFTGLMVMNLFFLSYQNIIYYVILYIGSTSEL